METLPGLEVVRAELTPIRAKRADDEPVEAMPTLDVRFSHFGNWYRISSFWEGEFMERVERGAFAKTIKEQGDRVRVLFDHGFDPVIGNKVLGAPQNLREDEDAAAADVPLFDTSYNRDLLPGLVAGQYGASFRFVVVKDEWVDEPDPSESNPRGLPERTIKEVRLIEFGPVTFPANPESTTGVRSTTDEFYERLRARDPQRVEALARARDSRTLPAAAAGSTTADPAGAARTTPDEPDAGDGAHHSAGLTHAQRVRLLRIRKEGS